MLYYIKTPVPLDIINKFCQKIFFCFFSLSLSLSMQVCVLILLTNLYCTWTNLSYQDKTWVEFSTLEDAVCMLLPTKWPNLELKTQPNQLLGANGSSSASHFHLSLTFLSKAGAYLI
jgi:hypothetical protein